MEEFNEKLYDAVVEALEAAAVECGEVGDPRMGVIKYMDRYLTRRYYMATRSVELPPLDFEIFKMNKQQFEEFEQGCIAENSSAE